MNQPRIAPVIWVPLILCCAIELVLTLSDLTGGSLRSEAIALGGFWPGLLGRAQALYPGQSAAMFFTYSLLHGGVSHLALNMITLVTIGSVVVARAGQAAFAEIYLAATIAGGVGYALIGPGNVPMVGASGALFGLAGALIGWEIADARRRGTSLAPALRLILLFVVLNVVLWWLAGGRLAWQTHLGGGIAGLALALTRAHRA